MLDMKKRRKLCGGILFLLLVVVPLICFPMVSAELKFTRAVEEYQVEKLVTFTYSGGKTTSCYVAPEGRADEGMGYVFLPSYADLTSLKVGTLADRAVFESGDGETVIVKRDQAGTTAFRENVVYDLKLLDRGGKEKLMMQVTFLKSGNLPTVYVNTDSGSMEYLDEDKDRKEEGTIEILDQNGRTLLVDSLKTVSARGNQTFTFEKKSYHIRMSSAADLFGMGKSDSWILLSNVYDPSYIRNKLAYDMAIQAGMEGSTESVYVDVYFNGRYNGMYMLCEKIELGENRLELQDLEKQNKRLNGNLDEAYRYITENEKQKGVDLAVNPEDITGGYLIEHDYSQKYAAEISGFVTDGGEQYVIKSPLHASRQEIEYISGIMQDIEDAIEAEDGRSPSTGKHFTEYIDLDSWADKYIVEEISRNNAGGLTSSFFYKDSDSVDSKIYGGPVWDFDKAFGRVGGYNRNTRNISYMMLHSGRSTRWFYYLCHQPEFMEAVRKEYAEKFSDYLETMAEKKVSEYADTIRESSVLDIQRFLPIYQEYDEVVGCEDKQEYIQQFLKERKTFLDEVWIGEAETKEVRFLNLEGELIYAISVVKGEPIGYLPNEVDSSWASGWVLEGTDERIDELTSITEDITVTPVWDE